MAQFVWKGRTRQGATTGGVLVADSKDLAIADLRRRQIDVTTVKEKGKELARPEARARQGQRAPTRDLHAPVLGHDRRGPAARAVPRDPRKPAGQPALPEDHPRRPPGRRGGLVARRGDAQAPEGVRRPLREHGRRRRGGRYPRHDPPAPLDLHREGGQAQGPGQDGPHLPDLGPPRRGDRRLHHPAGRSSRRSPPSSRPSARSSRSRRASSSRRRTSSRATSSSSSRASSRSCTPSSATTRPTAAGA